MLNRIPALGAGHPPLRTPAKKPRTPSARGTPPRSKKFSPSPASLMKNQSNAPAISSPGPMWSEHPVLLADSPAMQGRKVVNGALGDSPALRFTLDGEEDQEGVSMWGGEADDLSLALFTDIDEVLDEDVRIGRIHSDALYTDARITLI